MTRENDKTAGERLLEDETALDRALARSQAPAPPADLMGRILDAAPTPNGNRLPGWLFPLWRPAGALAVALVLGVAAGAIAPPELSGTQQVASADDVGLLDNDVPALAALDETDSR